MSLLDVSQWLYAYAFMCLCWRRWIWVIQFWKGCVRKMSFSVLRRAACSKPWKDATDGKQAGMKEKSHRVSSVGQQDPFPFWLSAEGGEVLVKG